MPETGVVKEVVMNSGDSTRLGLHVYRYDPQWVVGKRIPAM